MEAKWCSNYYYTTLPPPTSIPPPVGRGEAWVFCGKTIVFFGQLTGGLFSPLQLPDIHSFVETLFSKAKEYEKSTKKSNSDGGKD